MGRCIKTLRVVAMVAVLLSMAGIAAAQGFSADMRTAAEDGTWWQEFRNVKLGEPDPALFEIPAGYKKFAMTNF